MINNQDFTPAIALEIASLDNLHTTKGGITGEANHHHQY